MKRTLLQSGALFVLAGLIAVRADEPSTIFNLNSVELIKIFEVVIAGIVASAIILAVLALFIGQWSGKKQKNAIKKIRKNIENDEKHIQKSVTTINKNSIKIQQLITHVEKKSSTITSKQHQAWIHLEDIEEMVEDASECAAELQQTTDNVNHRMDQIKTYWDGQLKDTEDVVERVQSTLEKGLKRVESGIEELEQNEIKSRLISKKMVKAYQQQSETLIENASTSDKVRTNLQKAFEESKHLLLQLDQHRKTAKKSFQQFNNELSNYESQTYEQFDNAFQANDIARQELTANINESRQHIDNLRRYETECRNIKLQTRNHLDSMNSKSIKEFAITLQNTQQMFATLQNDMKDAQHVIETLHNQTHTIVDEKDSESRMEFQAISGDSTLVPFYSSTNK